MKLFLIALKGAIITKYDGKMDWWKNGKIFFKKSWKNFQCSITQLFQKINT